MIHETRNNLEYLTIRSADHGGLKVRSLEGNAGRVLEGLAVVFNSLSEPLGEMPDGRAIYEKMAPGSLDECLRGSPDVRALYNHDTGAVLGRTKAGTLSLLCDPTGLRCQIRLTDTVLADDLVKNIEAGNIDGMSFGFLPDWESIDYTDGVNDEGEECCIRTITRVRLLAEVSVVTFPAYPATKISARSLPDFEKFIKPRSALGHNALSLSKRRLEIHQHQLNLWNIS
jgi:HK97 family phage prohead protease